MVLASPACYSTPMIAALYQQIGVERSLSLWKGYDWVWRGVTTFINQIAVTNVETANIIVIQHDGSRKLASSSPTINSLSVRPKRRSGRRIEV